MWRISGCTSRRKQRAEPTRKKARKPCGKVDGQRARSTSRVKLAGRKPPRPRGNGEPPETLCRGLCGGRPPNREPWANANGDYALARGSGSPAVRRLTGPLPSRQAIKGHTASLFSALRGIRWQGEKRQGGFLPCFFVAAAGIRRWGMLRVNGDAPGCAVGCEGKALRYGKTRLAQTAAVW